MKQDYNQLAEVYARSRTLHPMVLERMIELSGLSSEARVLEIGCGTGNYIKAIAAETNAICTGIDPSREMLRIARRDRPCVGPPPDSRRHPNADVTFIQGSAEELSVPDRQFDLAFSVDVIHHVQRREDAAREAYRVLKPGGLAVIVTEREEDIRHRTPQVTYFPATIEVELQRYPSISTIERELRDAGFRQAEAIPVSMPKEVTDIGPYRDKAFSSLHLIPAEAFAAGIARMEEALRHGPIRGNRRYTMVVARRPL